MNGLFVGLMVCAVCAREEEGLPDVSSDWRSLTLNGQQFYVCPDHLPADGSNSEAYKTAYVALIEELVKKIN